MCVAAATGKSGVSDVLPDGTISSMPWRKAGEASPDSEQPLIGGDTVFMASAKSELARVSPKADMLLLHAHQEAGDIRQLSRVLLDAEALFIICDIVESKLKRDHVVDVYCGLDPAWDAVRSEVGIVAVSRVVR